MIHEWFIFPRPEPDDDDAPRPPLRLRTGRIAVAGTVLAVLGAGGFAGYRATVRWADERNERLAHTFLDQQDYRSAQLLLKQAVQVNPASVRAHRALARFYDQVHSPLALSSWREVVALSPSDDEAKLSLAESALRFNELAEMQGALNAVSPAGHATVGYHRFAAALALARRDLATLKTELETLAKLEPANIGTRIGLASLRLRSPEPAEQAAARAELEQLAHTDSARIHATLVLLLALPANDSAAIQALAQRLLPEKTAGGTARDWPALLRYLQAQPQPVPDDAAALIDTMSQRGLAHDALTWADTLPADTRQAPVMLTARAQAALLVRDWRLLHQLIADGAWGWIKSDAVDLAFAARVQRERSRLTNSRATWDDALALAQETPPSLRVLRRIAEEFGWSEETRRTLEATVRVQPRDQATWETLIATAEAHGETEAVWELFRDWTRAMPDSTAARARRVLLSLVLDRPDAGLRAELTSPDLEAQPAIIAAQALVNWRQNNQAAAKSAVAALTGPALLDPHVALVAAIILADTKETAASARLIANLPTTRLLPEEQRLLRTAQERIRNATDAAR